jgi:hypothetical protein
MDTILAPFWEPIMYIYNKNKKFLFFSEGGGSGEGTLPPLTQSALGEHIAFLCMSQAFPPKSNGMAQGSMDGYPERLYDAQ